MDIEAKSVSGLIFEPGTVIAGRYEIYERLGAGGVGMVYRALDRDLDEIIALKLLLPHLAQDENVFRRFRNEVLVARALSHPNIVRTHDMGRAEGSYSYISMEFVDGVSLKDKLLTRTQTGEVRPSLKFEEALSILYQVISGVAYAHGRGVIHRDLKPANVLISKAGEVKLADFGTARIMGMDTTLTQTGQVIGTPDYMSPEQIRGEQLDPSCDIYALGIMAYELVTGERPFMAESAVAVAFKHLNDPIPNFASAERGIPVWFAEVVSKATAKKKGDRFASVMEFAATLLDYAPQLSVHSTFFSVDRSTLRGGAASGSFQSPYAAPDKPAADDSREFRFELGASGAAPSDDEGWRLGSGATGESDQQFVRRPGAETNEPSSGAGKKVGMVLGGIAALLILCAITGRLLGSDDPALRDPLRAMKARHPAIAESLALLFGVSLEDRPEDLKIGFNTRRSSSAGEASSKTASASASSEPARIAVSSASSIVETREPDTKPVKTPAPEKEPVAVAVATPVNEPVKTPEPPPAPLVFSGSIMFQQGARDLGDDSISVDHLDRIKWAASLLSTGGSSESALDSKAAQNEFALNVFDLRKGVVVAKIKPEQADAANGWVKLSGTLRTLKNMNIGAGSLRVDLIRNGEVVTSKDLVLYKASAAPPAPPPGRPEDQIRIVNGSSVPGAGQPVPTAVAAVQPTPFQTALVQPTPALPPSGSNLGSSAPPLAVANTGGLPVAKGHENDIRQPEPVAVATPAVMVAPAIAENYGGFLRIPGDPGGQDDRREMIMNLVVQGEQLSGNATIAGFDPFTVSGRVLARGLEIDLRNTVHSIRMTSGPRDRNLRGIYTFPAIQKRGNFELRRTN